MSSRRTRGEQRNYRSESDCALHGTSACVVDIGQKIEGLIPAAEFSETEIPRPDPNATIEVQRTGEKKDGYVIVSLPESAAPPHLGKAG